MVIRLLKPRTRIVDADDGKHFRSDLVDVRFISNSYTGPLDVLGVGIGPRIDRVHGSSAVCRVGRARLASVDGGVSFRGDGTVPEREGLAGYEASKAMM